MAEARQEPQIHWGISPETLRRTQEATFSLDLPDPRKNGMPTPHGTGFFISRDGWVTTAAHVVTEDGLPSGKPRGDINQGLLQKELRIDNPVPAMCQHLELRHVDSKNDFALIKVDFAKNQDKEFLKDKKAFPFIEVSKRRLQEGEAVYSFGYPLSRAEAFEASWGTIGVVEYCPRVTSAIVSSTFERSKMIASAKDTQVYVLDKALNYGNSGGPIVAASTGKVHAICSRFQPMSVRQPHMRYKCKPMWIQIPSLYGIVVSLANPEIQGKFEGLGISCVVV